jgi:photoactive yellow protein
LIDASDTPVDFDAPHLAQAVERLSDEAIHDLPFGAIRMGADGVVQFYSRGEAALSGYGTRPAVGLSFFTHVAPCLDTDAFKGRIDRALASGQLDVEFGWIGTFDNPDLELRVRAQPALGGGYWIFIKREEG